MKNITNIKEVIETGKEIANKIYNEDINIKKDKFIKYFSLAFTQYEVIIDKSEETKKNEITLYNEILSLKDFEWSRDAMAHIQFIVDIANKLYQDDLDDVYKKIKESLQ